MTANVKGWSKARQNIVLLFGLLGMLIGILIGTWNADVFGWALLRVAILGAGFAWGARVMTHRLMRAWLESKIKEAEVQATKKDVRKGPRSTKPAGS